MATRIAEFIIRTLVDLITKLPKRVSHGDVTLVLTDLKQTTKIRGTCVVSPSLTEISSAYGSEFTSSGIFPQAWKIANITPI